MARASVFANWGVQIENTENTSNVHVASMDKSIGPLPSCYSLLEIMKQPGPPVEGE